jgi:catechol 2,3-dioxygenase-like lactoylglutathione lyase family enzyme
MINGIGHVAFAVVDLDRSLGFYCGKLGLEEAFRLEDPGGPVRALYLKAGPGQFVELFPSDWGASPPERTVSASSYRHLCLVVGDLPDFVEALRMRGVEFSTELKRGVRDRNWQIFVEDPDGNRIELMDIDPASPQALAR